MTNSSTPSFKGQDVYCGIDVHKSTWAISARCNGVEMFHGTVAASPRVAVQTLQHRFPEARFHCAYEAGFCGFGIHRELVAAGFDSIVVNPADIPTNGKERVFKNDSIDSGKIARHLEHGELVAIDVPSVDLERMRCLVRRETQIRDAATRENNQLKAALYFHGEPVPKYLSNAVLQRLWRHSCEANDFEMASHIRLLLFLRGERQRIIKDEKKLQAMLGYADDVERLQGIPGIAFRTASVLQCELGDVSRFPTHSRLAAYVGLAPRLVGSGDEQKVKGGVSRKKGQLHYLLIQSAWAAVRTSTEFGSIFARLAKSKGNRKRAIVAVAKKLLFIAYAVLRDKVPYAPGMPGKARKGLEKEEVRRPSPVSPPQKPAPEGRTPENDAARRMTEKGMEILKQLASEGLLNEEDMLCGEYGVMPPEDAPDDFPAVPWQPPHARRRSGRTKQAGSQE